MREPAKKGRAGAPTINAHPWVLGKSQGLRGPGPPQTVMRLGWQSAQGGIISSAGELRPKRLNECAFARAAK